MKFNFHFGELHSDNSINDKNNLFENYIPKCYRVKIILISFNCFSEYIYLYLVRRKSVLIKGQSIFGHVLVTLFCQENVELSI